MVGCYPGILGVIIFAAGCIVAGMYFIGVDANPPDKTGLTVSIVQKWIGIIMLGVTFLFFLTSPIGPELSIWAGTLFGMFAFIWLVFSDTLSKGGDFKPLAWFGLVTLLILVVPFALICNQLMVVPELRGLMIDFAILLWPLLLGGLFLFLGARGTWPGGIKATGAVLIYAGIIGMYIVIKYLPVFTSNALLAG